MFKTICFNRFSLISLFINSIMTEETKCAVILYFTKRTPWFTQILSLRSYKTSCIFDSTRCVKLSELCSMQNWCRNTHLDCYKSLIDHYKSEKKFDYPVPQMLILEIHTKIMAYVPAWLWINKRHSLHLPLMYLRWIHILMWKKINKLWTFLTNNLSVGQRSLNYYIE